MFCCSAHSTTTDISYTYTMLSESSLVVHGGDHGLSLDIFKQSCPTLNQQPSPSLSKIEKVLSSISEPADSVYPEFVEKNCLPDAEPYDDDFDYDTRLRSDSAISGHTISAIESSHIRNVLPAKASLYTAPPDLSSSLQCSPHPVKNAHCDTQNDAQNDAQNGQKEVELEEEEKSFKNIGDLLNVKVDGALFGLKINQRWRFECK